MGAVTKLSIELPHEMADEVRALVESGRFASESEALQAGWWALKDNEAAESDPALEEWLRTEAVAAHDEWKANPSAVHTLDEVREKLRRKREAEDRGA